MPDLAAVVVVAAAEAGLAVAEVELFFSAVLVLVELAGLDSFFFGAADSDVVAGAAGAAAAGVDSGEEVMAGDSSTVAEAFSSVDGEGDSSWARANDAAALKAMMNGITGFMMCLVEVEL